MLSPSNANCARQSVALALHVNRQNKPMKNIYGVTVFTPNILKHFLTLTIFFCLAEATQAQNVGVGTNSPSQRLDVQGNMRTRDKVVADRGVVIGEVSPDTSTAIFSTDVTNKGFYIPRLTSAQKNSLGASLVAANKGLLVFDTDLNRADYWDGTQWKPIGDGVGGPPTGTAGGGLTGSYPNPSIANNAVSSVNIVDGSITGDDLATGAVDLSTNKVTGVLPVSKGGTGNSNLTAKRVIIGDGTNPITVSNASAPGQVLIGNSTNDPTFTTFTQDVTVNASGQTTISNDAVNSAKILNGTISDDDLSTTGVAANTYTKVTVSNKGRVTAAANLATTDIPAGSVTADNGLNVNTGNNVRLGGTLAVNTTVDQGSNSMLFSGTGLFGVGATATGNKLNINPGTINTAFSVNGFPTSSTGKTGIAVDMANTSSSNGIAISNIGSSGMNGISINSTANGNGTGIRIGETNTLSTGINIRGGSGIIYNALNAGSGTGLAIGGTTRPNSGVVAEASGTDATGGSFLAANYGTGTGLIGGVYSSTLTLSSPKITGVFGYASSNSTDGSQVQYGVYAQSSRGGNSGTTTSYGLFATANGTNTSNNGLHIGLRSNASVVNAGTGGAIAGQFNATANSGRHLALAATGGADVYLGSTDADRPSNFTGAVVGVSTGNTNTTYMHNARLSNQLIFRQTGTGSNTATVVAPSSISTSYTMTLPTAQGASNTVLRNDGSGNLTWANVAVPTGVIVMWSGTLATIPTGWALCDGTSGTPDLRNRFILSVSTSENPGTTGGTHSYSLTVGQLPAHSHTGTTGNTTPSLTFTGNTGTTSSDGAGQVGNMLWDDAAAYYASGTLSLSAGTRTRSWSGTSGSAMRALNLAAHTHTFTPSGTISGGSHNHSFTTNNTGSGDAIDNRPAFYKLAFIMKL